MSNSVSTEVDEGVVQQESEEHEHKALSDSEIKVPRFCLAVVSKFPSYTVIYCKKKKRKTVISAPQNWRKLVS